MKFAPAVFCLGIALSSHPAFAELKTPQTPDFVYQGFLESNGTPVNGPSDLEFSLWDSAVDGSQVGQTIIEQNYPIVDGIFSINLAFPEAFNGEQKFLQVIVNGVILPRQPISTAPIAQFALTGAPGPAGPQGPAGVPGPPGPAGTPAPSIDADTALENRLASNNYAASSSGESPSVTVTIGNSGKVVIILAFRSVVANANNKSCYMSFAASGANILGASDTNGFYIRAGTATVETPGRTQQVVLSGLTPGPTTFTTQYRVAPAPADRCIYSNPSISAFPVGG